jgi:hypothetical protein
MVQLKQPLSWTQVRAFKHSCEMREYWRLEKRKQRTGARGAKEAKTEQSEKIGAGVLVK